ncbi:hypothetical protein Rhopal_007311-T1 [Rhodotorula paludigena]|uniref:Uncharacterized protein n=1 Tax=Rhodotorula paludigena TaxID=86838 RepID=A0AAV5GYY9_9BASI|nr:hypothetical protein Rhopal_007311-T1 [Rhodotorula paludigena]
MLTSTINHGRGKAVSAFVGVFSDPIQALQLVQQSSSSLVGSNAPSSPMEIGALNINVSAGVAHTARRLIHKTAPAQLTAMGAALSISNPAEFDKAPPTVVILLALTDGQIKLSVNTLPRFSPANWEAVAATAGPSAFVRFGCRVNLDAPHLVEMGTLRMQGSDVLRNDRHGANAEGSTASFLAKLRRPGGVKISFVKYDSMSGNVWSFNLPTVLLSEVGRGQYPFRLLLLIGSMLQRLRDEGEAEGTSYGALVPFVLYQRSPHL